MMMNEAELRQKAERAAVKTRMKKENMRQTISEKRSEEMIRNTILWRDKIIPKWKSVRNSSKVYELATKGIPPCLRRQVWQLMIGSEIMVTEDVYRSLHEKAIMRFQQVQQREKQYAAAKHQQQFAVAMSEAGGCGDGVCSSPVVGSERDEDDCEDVPMPSKPARMGRSQSQDGSVRRLDDGENEMQGQGVRDEGSAEDDKQCGVDCVLPVPGPAPATSVTPSDGVVRTIRLRSYSANDSSSNNNSNNGNMLANVLLADASSESDIKATPDDEGVPAAEMAVESTPNPASVPDTPFSEDEITRTITKFNQSHHYTGLGMDYSAIKAGPVLTPDISALGGRTQLGPSNVTPLQSTPMVHTPRGRMDSAGPVDSGHRFDTVALIQYDLPRTFPTLGFFHDGGPLNDALNKVLHAFSCFRPDVGYVQGMSFIVAMLLLYMSELEAFQALINLVGRRACLEFYRLKKEAIDNYVQVFNHFFKQTLPMLFDHFAFEGVTSEMYLLDWNLSLFCKALPLEVAARIWDCYLLEGEVFIVRTALGLLRMHAPTMCVQSMEQIMKVLVHFPDDIDVDLILSNIDHIKISNKKYEQMRRKYDMQDLSLAGVTATANARSSNRPEKSGKFPLLTALGLYNRSGSGRSQPQGESTEPVASDSEPGSPNKEFDRHGHPISPSSSDSSADSLATAQPRNPKQVAAEHEARMRLMEEAQRTTGSQPHTTGTASERNRRKGDKDDCSIM